MRRLWPVWGRRRTATQSRPRVAQAIQAARAAQTTHAALGYLAVYVVGGDAPLPTRSLFDGRRASAWQTIDATLRELRAS